MSSPPPLVRHAEEALRAAIAQSPPTTTAIAAAFDGLCMALRDRLNTVFGTVAVSALFARAVHLATAEFPWLKEVFPPGSGACALQGLQTVQGHVEPHTLAQALAAVLGYEIRLLSELVGEDLTMPLVQDAWASPGQSDITKGQHPS
jgi:hypothetical protein